MRRVALALTTVVALAGCGSTKTQSRDASVGQKHGPTMGPYLFDIPGAVKALKQEGVPSRATGKAGVAAKSLPAPSESAAYDIDGTPVTLFLFPSEDLADDAQASLNKVPGDIVIGKNILAIVGRKGPNFARVTQAISTLGDNPPGPEPRFPAPGEPNS